MKKTQQHVNRTAITLAHASLTKQKLYWDFIVPIFCSGFAVDIKCEMFKMKMLHSNGKCLLASTENYVFYFAKRTLQLLQT